MGSGKLSGSDVYDMTAGAKVCSNYQALFPEKRNTSTYGGAAKPRCEEMEQHKRRWVSSGVMVLEL